MYEVLSNAVYNHRKQKLEKELANNVWKVNYKEIALRARQPGSLRSQVTIIQLKTLGASDF